MYTPALKLNCSRIFSLTALTLNYGVFSTSSEVLTLLEKLWLQKCDWDSWRTPPTSTVQMKRAKQKSSTIPLSRFSIVKVLNAHSPSTKQTGKSRTSRPVFTIQQLPEY